MALNLTRPVLFYAHLHFHINNFFVRAQYIKQTH